MVGQAQRLFNQPEKVRYPFFENEIVRSGKGRGDLTAHLRNQAFSDSPLLCVKVKGS